jgi:hypothetical protein
MKRNNRLGTVSVGKLQYLLTPRDIAIITAVREWRFLTTKQIYQLYFADHASYTSGIRACTRVLGRLRELRLLYRLKRPVGGPAGGSASYVWAVDAAGDRLLRADPNSGFTKRFRAYQPTPLFLEHTLAVAEARVRLEALQRTGALEVFEIQPEPRSWRPFNWGGRSQVLKPDLYVVTALGNDEWHRYVEVDRSTESLQILVEKKARAYEAYVATGADQAHLGIVPQVLWLVPDQLRAKRFRAALAAARNLTVRLHQIIIADKLEAEFLGQIPPTFGTDSDEGGS